MSLLIELQQKYPLIEKKLHDKNREYECGGVYGLFLKVEHSIGQYTTSLDYIGWSDNIYFRCHRDHPKPSQPLAENMVYDLTKRWRHNYEDDNRLKDYNVIARYLLNKYEFRVMFLESNKVEGKKLESQLIFMHQPKFNTNHR